VIELGAGLAIPTVRMQSESTARRFGFSSIRIPHFRFASLTIKLTLHSFSGVLIRINPRDYNVPTDNPSHISIPLGALAALQQIEKYYNEEI
jgi:hypothetical protein